MIRNSLFWEQQTQSQTVQEEAEKNQILANTSERDSFVIDLMSSFPVQSLGIESLSWLNTVLNLKSEAVSNLKVKTTEDQNKKE